MTLAVWLAIIATVGACVFVVLLAVLAVVYDHDTTVRSPERDEEL